MTTQTVEYDNAVNANAPARCLEACINAVLSCYDAAPDIYGALAKLSRPTGPLNSADIPDLFKKLGFTAEKIATEWETVKKAKLPAVIVFNNEFSAAYLPTVKEADGIFVPEGSSLDENLASGIASIHFIHPPFAIANIMTSHMKWGHTLDWFWQPVIDFRHQYGEILLCSFFTNLFVFAMPLFSMNVYDRVAVNFSESTLVVLATGVVIALLFDFMFKTLRSYVLEHVAARVGAKFDMDLMERLMSIKSTAMNLSIGERSNLFRELQGIKDFYASRLAPSLIDLPFFFVFVIVIFVLSPAVSVVPVVAAIAILLVNFGLQVPVNRSTKKYFASLQGKSSILVQTLAGIETSKMLGATGSQLFQWGITSSKSIEASRQNNILATLSNNMCVLVTYLVNVFVLYVGVYKIAEGELTVGALVACTTLSSRAIGPIVNLSGLVSKLKQSNDVLKAIDKVFQLPHEDTELQTSAKGPFRGKIQLQNVNFQYQGQPKPALADLSLSIKPGERVGLIGKTGAGKSTLMKMLCQALEPQSGTIFLDDHAMNTISPEELRRAIGYVPQDGFFFSGSIRSNVLMGNDDASSERLQEAVRISGLDIILHNAGIGLDAEVGENGNRLSGGQKQAISLARALVRNPSILIFDEPTNGIDSALEMTIKQNLNEYLSNKTFIMITHRTSLLSLVNRLILIDRGQILADGPTDEIMSKLGGQAQR
jgi:ATP-binding cassette subfamily C protein LapB